MMMNKTLPVCCLLLLCSLAFPSVAQRAPSLKKDPQAPVSRELQLVRDDLKNRYTQNQSRAMLMARKNGWVVSQKSTRGGTLSLQGVDDQGMPIYYETYDNVKAAATTSTDQVWPGNQAGLNLTGSHPALAGKFGIWDGGRVRATHQELTGRVVQRDGATANDNHATHVAGTLMASGINSRARGMAHGAADLQAWDFNFDIPEIAEAASQLLVSNHSYGSTTGWRYNGSRSPQWEWWGDLATSSTEDIKFGQYNFQARDLDQIAYYAPYYLMVKAAGNNRTDNGPAVGEPFWRINADRTAWELVDNRPAGISNNDGFESIPTYGNTKNMLLVGAVDPIEGGYAKPTDVRIAAFSSWGPTDDGRIKPDLVGNGVGVYSSTAGNDGAYSYYNGTSMASPNVAGSLFLLQEHFANLNNGTFMRAATLKGVAIHTADEAGPAPGPDYVHGWGLLNTKKAADVISNAEGRHLLQERTLAQGETYTLQVKAAGDGPLRVTISWTDPEGAISTSLNDRTPRLVNDLDVRVLQGLTTYSPWVLNPAAPTAPATFGDNIRDNVEHLYIANAVAGQTYTVSVSHKGMLQRGPQAFSLVVSGVSAPLYCTSRPSSDADSRLTRVDLGTIRQAFTDCAAYRDLTHLAPSVELGHTVPFALTLGTCGVSNPKMARIFVDWNSDGDFADGGETVATSGVVAGTAVFSGAFPIPAATVQAGDRVRVRIVLMETENTGQLQPCGTYAKGETQDYYLQINASTSDVGVTALVAPQDGLCATLDQTISLTVKNYGTQTQTNIPVTTEIWDGATLIATLQGTFSGTLEPHREATFTLPGSFATVGGKTYSFVSTTELSTDQNSANNTHTATFTTSSPAPAPTDPTAEGCGDGPVVLKASSEGTLFWYDAPLGGTLLGTGPAITTPARPADNKYYVAANDFSGSVGPKTKNAFKGGGYNQYATDVYFSTQVPLMMEKVRLYIGHPGRIILSVQDTRGKEIASASLDVAATRKTPGSGSQTNDPSDPGALYDLDLEIPAAGDYVLKIAYQHGATIFRNNSGVTGYPFSIPGVIAITGNNTSSIFYYYLYDLQVKALGCASARVPVTLESSEPAADLTVSGPTSFCEGGEVVLQVPENTLYSYQWYTNSTPIAGATASSYRATATGTYHATVTNPQNPAACSLGTSVTATVTVLPSTIAGEAKNSAADVCSGSNAGTVTLSGHAGAILRWESSEDLVSWTAIPDTTATLAFNDLLRTSYFRAVVQHGTCEIKTSRVATVTVTAKPQAVVSARGATTFCQGGFVTLAASAGTSYLWSSGQTTRTINVTASGSYSVTVTNENGCPSTSAPTVVTVNPIPVATITANGPTSFCEGNTVTLTASEGASYRWSNGQTTRSITVATTGSYAVTVTDALGCAAVSVPVSVKVQPLPIATISADGPTSVCEGGSVTLIASEGASYRWSTGETARSITVRDSGSYTVTVTNAANCAATSAPLPVTVHALPAAVIAKSGPLTFCEGGSVALTAAEGAAYQWSNGETSRAITVSRGGAYSVTVTNTEGCSTASEEVNVTVQPLPTATISAVGPTTFCAGGSVVLTASEGASYRWSNGQTSRSITVQAGGVYQVTVLSEAGCEAISEAVPVRVLPVPAALITPRGATAFCEGSHVVLAASEGAKYLWSTGQTTRTITATTSGTYTVTITTDEGCSSTSAPVAVTVQPLPTATVSVQDPTSFCEGESVTLTAPEGASYRWSSGETARTITVRNSGSYAVTVTNGAGCAVISQPVSVAVSSAIANNLVSGAQAVCSGATPAALSGTLPTGGENVYGFLWESSTSGPTAGFSPAPGFNKGAHYAPQPVSQATWFRRVVYSGTCSNASPAILISVKVPPSASIEESTATTICEGTTTTLTAKGGNRFLWSTGDLTQSISVTKSGTYTATVINEEDCFAVTQAVSITVKITPPAPKIMQKENWLFSSFPTGNQWYRDGVAITGATEQAYEAFLPGSYTVVSSQNGCLSAPSAAVSHQAMIDEQTLRLAVFPNPSHGSFSVDFEVQGMENGHLRLVNMLGQEVYRREVTSLSGKQSIRVEAEHLAPGMYILQVRVKDKVFTRRVQIRR